MRYPISAPADLSKISHQMFSRKRFYSSIHDVIKMKNDLNSIENGKKIDYNQFDGQSASCMSTNFSNMSEIERHEFNEK